MKLKNTLLLTLASLCLGGLTSAHARFVLTLAETGSGLTLTGTGSFNTTNLTYFSSGTGSGIVPSSGYAVPGAGRGDVLLGLSGPSSFGTNQSFLAASTSSGGLAGISSSNGMIFVPASYVSGTILNNSSTFTGKTLAELGITAGTYNYSFNTGANADTVVFNVVAAVPEPSTYAMLLGGAGVFALALRNRRKA